MHMHSDASPQFSQLFLALSNNALEVYKIPSPQATKKEKNAIPEASRLYSVDLPGHRTDIRTVSISADDQILASASSGMYAGIRFILLSPAAKYRSSSMLFLFHNILNRPIENLEHANNSVHTYYGMRIRDMQCIPPW